MIKEEDYILQKFGRKEPFTVPEGYFDNLTERIMDSLPKEEGHPVLPCQGKNRVNMRWIGWCSVAAACVACLAFLVVTVSRPNEGMAGVDVLAEEHGEYDEEYQQDVMRYAMLGHEDVYCYLSGTGF